MRVISRQPFILTRTSARRADAAKRGNDSNASPARTAGRSLQLSHVHSNVETLVASHDHRAPIRLQLSHVHSNVETSISASAMWPGASWLQLSHVHSNVETGAMTVFKISSQSLQLSHVHSNVETLLMVQLPARQIILQLSHVHSNVETTNRVC